MPGNYGSQVDETTLEAYVGNVRAPDLVRPVRDHVSEKVWEDSVLQISLRQSRFRIDDLQSHQTHEALDSFAVHVPALVFIQPAHDSAAAQERFFGVFLVDQLHQLEILSGLGHGLIVVAGPSQTKQLALPGDAELSVSRLNEGSKVVLKGGQIFFSTSPTPS